MPEEIRRAIHFQIVAASLETYVCSLQLCFWHTKHALKHCQGTEQVELHNSFLAPKNYKTLQQ